MAVVATDLLRLDLRPGLHGAHCTRCDRLFDAYDTPAPLADVLARVKTMICGECGERDKLMLLMPHKYREMVADAIRKAEAREALMRKVDKYIPRI